MKWLLIIFLLITSPCWGGVSLPGVDSGDDYILTTGDADTTADEITMSAWIAPTFATTETSAPFIIDKSNGNASGYRLLFAPAGDDFRCRIFTAGGGVNCDTTGVTWSVGETHHLGCRYDGSNIRIYWDGVLEATCAQTGNITTNNVSVQMGLDEASATNNWIGAFTEMVIWDSDIGSPALISLAVSKVKRLPLQLSPSTLLIYLPLDNFADGTALNTDADGYKDLSGNGHHGTGIDANAANGSTNLAETVLTYQ